MTAGLPISNLRRVQRRPRSARMGGLLRLVKRLQMGVRCRLASSGDRPFCPQHASDYPSANARQMIQEFRSSPHLLVGIRAVPLAAFAKQVRPSGVVSTCHQHSISGRNLLLQQLANSQGATPISSGFQTAICGPFRPTPTNVTQRDIGGS